MLLLLSQAACDAMRTGGLSSSGHSIAAVVMTVQPTHSFTARNVHKLAQVYGNGIVSNYVQNEASQTVERLPAYCRTSRASSFWLEFRDVVPSQVRGAGETLATNITHHLQLGFQRMYIYFDDPLEASGIEGAAFACCVPAPTKGIFGCIGRLVRALSRFNDAKDQDQRIQKSSHLQDTFISVSCAPLLS